MPEDPAKILADLLSQGLSGRFRAGGPSMHPSIRDGEIVEIKPYNARQPLRIGQIILFRAYDRLIVHRITKITGNKIQTAGDASLKGGESVTRSEVLGTAVSVIRNGYPYRLDRPYSRIFGIIRYHLRPVRALAHKWLASRHHDATPCL